MPGYIVTLKLWVECDQDNLDSMIEAKRVIEALKVDDPESGAALLEFTQSKLKRSKPVAGSVTP